MGWEEFDTTKGRESFESDKSFIEYCIEVAKSILKLLTWK